MAHWLDDVAVSVAEGTPRRSMLRKLGAGIVGAVAVMAAGSGTAAAKDDKDKDKTCPPRHCCPAGSTFCGPPDTGICCPTSLGYACESGQCRPACAPGHTRCGNSCCPPGTTCNAATGVCSVACPTGTTPCPGAGGTTTCCGAGTTCQNGTCVPTCPTGTTPCPGAGGTTICCGAGMTCQNGACLAPCLSGMTRCPPPAMHCCVTGDACCGSTCCATGHTCQNGACVPQSCPTGTIQCGTQANGLPNCCPIGLPNATTTCGANNTCAITCAPGYANCDNNITTGCETNTVSNPANCGACGVVCPAGSVCQNGVCVPTGGGSGGCQSSADCGPCGICSAGVCVPANAGTVCRQATGPCDVPETCNGTTMQCPADSFRPAGFVCQPSSNPCMTTSFCTGSSATCPPSQPVANNTPCGLGGICQNGVCVPACPAGTIQCGTQASGAPNCCAIGPNQGTTCSGNTCVFRCAPGYANCDGNPSTGCETNVMTSPSSCGSCGNACVAPPNASAQCVNGQCMYTCNPGYQDCGDGSCIPSLQQCP